MTRKTVVERRRQVSRQQEGSRRTAEGQQDLVVGEGREEVEAEEREDGDDQEEDGNDVHDGPQGLQRVAQGPVMGKGDMRQ